MQGFDEDVHRIRIRTSNPDWLFIATRAGIYQSQNGGKSWEQLTTESNGIGYPDALLIHPHRENLMFMAGARTVLSHGLKIELPIHKLLAAGTEEKTGKFYIKGCRARAGQHGSDGDGGNGGIGCAIRGHQRWRTSIAMTKGNSGQRLSKICRRFLKRIIT